MFKTVNALVLREVRYKEADRILILLTDTEGKITAKARGALRKSSRTAGEGFQLGNGAVCVPRRVIPYPGVPHRKRNMTPDGNAKKTRKK